MPLSDVQLTAQGPSPAPGTCGTEVSECGRDDGPASDSEHWSLMRSPLSVSPALFFVRTDNCL